MIASLAYYTIITSLAYYTIITNITKLIMCLRFTFRAQVSPVGLQARATAADSLCVCVCVCVCDSDMNVHNASKLI